MPDTAYRFAQFELQPATRELLVEGRPARLGGRAFDVLLALVEERGRTVSRNALFERAWPGRVVEDQNLRVQINALRRVLGERAIATIPGRGYRFVLPLDDVAVEPPPPPADAGRVAAVPAGSNLPADLPPLFGRIGDIAAVYRLLSEQRLVTIAGPGGIGKTQLAQAVASQWRGRLRDGVWLAELAALGDPQRVTLTVAQALGLSGSAAHASAAGLARALRGHEALLILDNCEHLLAGAAELVQALLRGAPRLRVLATSQEPLKLADEHVFRLEALDVPPADPVEDALQFGAVALFVARARAADPRFRLDAGNVAIVSDICRQLDGIPLALELAAARVPLLGVAGVRDRLGERLRLLRGGARTAPARHQTLRSALEWSHALLTSGEQAALRRLALFAGSFALDAAQQVIADGAIDAWAALELLGTLVDKSLVQALVAPATDAAPRYRLLESTRAFALERLDAAGETATVRERHAAVPRRAFEAADTAYLATPSAEWLDRVLPDLDNLREAARWALAHGSHDVAAGLVAHSTGLWILSGQLREGLALLRAVQAQAATDLPPRITARVALAVAQYGGSGVSELTPPAALAGAREALAIYRSVGERLHEYWAMNFAIPLAERAGERIDVDAAIAQMRALEQPHWPPLALRLRRGAEARQLGRRGDWAGYRDAFAAEYRRLAALGEWRGALFAAQSQGLAELVLGNPRAAVAALQPVVEQIRAHGRLRQTWTPLGLLAGALVECGELDAAAAAFRELVPLMQIEGSLAWGIDHVAEWFGRRGDWADAARLHGWSNAMSARRGEQRGPAIRETHARVSGALPRHLAAAELERFTAEGAALDEDAVAAMILRACAV